MAQIHAHSTNKPLDPTYYFIGVLKTYSNEKTRHNGFTCSNFGIELCQLKTSVTKY